jgi:hypothetical protein
LNFANVNFLIADTFTDSLGRLTAQEQRAAKTTAFDLQIDPSSPGFSFHKLDRAKDANFWSVRVTADVRIIVHRTPSSLLLAYVAHHDAAYKWAERRKLERHPTTGAMQLVEIRERVEEVAAPAPKTAARLAKPSLFGNLRKFELMAFGVPEQWVDEVRAADEDTLFDVIGHLPQEAQEALLKLAVGEKPETPKPAPAEADPYAHPDSLRRFRALADVEALRRALDEPWEKWAVFLHPSQAALVARDFSGPARVSSSAGTGKTIVALHRAVHLTRKNPGAKVLLTTFSDALAHTLGRKLKTLAGGDADTLSHIEVNAIARVGRDLYASSFGAPSVAPPDLIRSLVAEAAAAAGAKYSLPFLLGEWSEVVEPLIVMSAEDYATVARLGRKTRLGAKQRAAVWPVFGHLRDTLKARGLTTSAEVFDRVAQGWRAGGEPPFDFALVDEAQDLGVAEARLLAALGDARPNALFFAGDLGQRIFQTPFSWKALGIDVRGRSSTLRVNYRTSHQIRTQADRLLPGAIADVDGNEESRKGTISVFDGPSPEIHRFPDAKAET